jgi:hypothetical protein
VLDLLVIYIIACIATSSVYYLFIFNPVLQENPDLDLSFGFKVSIFLAVALITPKVLLGMFLLKEQDIKDGLLRSIKNSLAEVRKSDLEE